MHKANIWQDNLIDFDTIYDNEDMLCIDTSDELYNAWCEDNQKVIYQNGQVILNPDYEEEKLRQLKNNKYKENDTKANTARYGQEFTLTIQDKECVFDTNQTTQADLLTAFAVCSTGVTYDGWVTNNGVVLDLTMEDIVLISTVFKEKSNVYGKWNEYKHEIDEAQTIEEIEAIEIDYDGEALEND